MEFAEGQKSQKEIVNDINDFSFLFSLGDLPIFRFGRRFHSKDILSIMIHPGKAIVGSFLYCGKHGGRGMRGREREGGAGWK